jgi:hypothetical protein
MATITLAGADGTLHRYRLPPPPPSDLSLPQRERWALRVLADVAAVQLTELPQRSLVPRLLEVPISELDHWASDPRYRGHALGEGSPCRRSVEERFRPQICRLREEG